MFIPYATSLISDDDKAAVMAVLDRNYLTRGQEMLALEDAFCELTGKKYAVAMSNATVALWAVLASYHLPYICSSTLTFSAIANAAALNYFDLHLVDVDVDTLCGEFPTAWNGVDDAVYVPMDYGGYPSLDRRIVPEDYGPKIVLDAAHSLGAKLVDGKSNTYYADVAVHSLHPCKIATSGEGGVVVTDDEHLVDSLRMLRNNGFKYGTHEWVQPGLNLHLPELGCALANSQLKRLDKLIARRQEIANFYYRVWKDDYRVILPAWHPGHVYHLFPIRLSESVNCTVEQFQSDLKELGVGTQRHYQNLHIKHQMGHPGDFPVAEYAYSRMLSIPMYVGLTDNDLTYVTMSINRTLDKYSK